MEQNGFLRKNIQRSDILAGVIGIGNVCALFFLNFRTTPTFSVFEILNSYAILYFVLGSFFIFPIYFFAEISRFLALQARVNNGIPVWLAYGRLALFGLFFIFDFPFFLIAWNEFAASLDPTIRIAMACLLSLLLPILLAVLSRKEKRILAGLEGADSASI